MRFLLNIGVCTLIIRTEMPFAWMRPKIPLFSFLKYEKMKRKSQVIYKLIFNKKTGDVIQRKKKETYKNLAIFSSTNQYYSNFEIPYHFLEVLHENLKTRQMWRRHQIKVGFAHTFCLFHPWVRRRYTSDIHWQTGVSPSSQEKVYSWQAKCVR